MNTLFSFFKKSIGAVIMTVLLLPAVASAQYIITATPNNATMGSASGGGNFSLGQTFTLTATPNNGYEFVRWEWEGNDLGNDNPFMMEIDASLDPGTYAFVAVFRAIPRQYNLNIVVQPVADAGTVDGAGLRPGGNKVLTAEETNPQYHWVGWFTSAQGETAVELGYQYTLALASDTTVYARFERVPQQHTVSVSVTPNAQAGTATVNGGQQATLYENSMVNLVATPANSNITFQNWTLNGTVVSTEANYSFRLPAMDSDPTYVANFIDNTQNYTITINRNNNNGGTVTGGGVYTGGGTATVTANPATGYDFLGWVEGTDTVSRETSYTFQVNRARTLTAIFRHQPFTVSVSASPVAGGSVSGSGTYAEGSNVTLIATPNAGYNVKRWMEGNTQVAGAVTSYAIQNIQGNHNVVVEFVQVYNISVTADGNGTVTGGGQYNSGSSATVTATPASDHAFVNWTENGQQVSTSASYTFTVSGARTLVAHFVQQYNVALSANPTAGGTVSGAGNYNAGANVSISATPATGYQFVNWTEGNTIVSTSASYTINNISAARTLVANFSVKTYNITTISSPQNGGSVNGTGNYQHGADVTLTPVPANGYTFTAWFENGQQISTANPLHFTATADRNIEARFSQQTQYYTVNASCNPVEGGTITRSAEGPYASGISLTLTASPAQNYTFMNWTEGGQVVSTNAAYTFEVTGNRTLVANYNYQAPPVNVNVTVSPANSGSVTGAGQYASGSTVNLAATPANGYQFYRWTENGVIQGTSSTLSFTASMDRNLVAEFQQIINNYTITAVADPVAGGTVTGSGVYAQNTNVTLTATPNTNYNFLRWTKNGAEVSTSNQYSFPATENCTVTAVFEYVTPMRTIAAVASPTNGGTISGLGNGQFADGASVTLTATPNDNFTFNNWTENGTVVSTSAAYTFTVSGNRSLVANFTENVNTYTISATCAPANSGSVSGTGNYAAGVQASLSATAASGYTFVNWTENGTVVSQQNPYNFTVSGNRSLVANFQRQAGNYTVTVVVDPVGAGTTIGSGTYAEGVTAQLTANPATGYNFIGWYNGTQLVATAQNYSFTVVGNVTLYARFELQAINYTINATVNPANAGTVSGTGSYAEGASVTLTATANNNYQFLNWTENGQVVYRNAVYRFAALGNRNLVANFLANQTQDYTITVVPNTVEGGTVTGGGQYNDGDAVTLTATPATNYYFVGWSENGSIFSSAETYTFIANGDRNITGVFECYCRTQVVLDAGEGVVSDGSGNSNYLPNTNCSWLIRPAGADSVTLTFTSFATVQGSDYVDIYDGATTSAPRIGHFSGHSLPPAVTSSTGTMLVRFTTASTQTDQGWEATYSTGYNDNDYLEYSDGTKTIVVGCNPNVTSVRVPGRVVKIASRAFEGCNNMVRVNIPSSVDTIEDHAFYYCSSLKDVELPANMHYLGNYAFAGCSALQNVTLPNLDTIRPYTFYNCNALKRIEIPSSVKWIGTNAFRYCNAVYSLNIPASVDTVDSYAFANMSNLKFVTLNAGNKHFGSYAFSGNSIQLTNFNGTIADWMNITFGNGTSNPMSSSRNFALAGQIVTDLVIPEGVDTVNNYAFYNNNHIFTLTIASTIKHIGASSFYSLTGLERIYLNAPQSTVESNSFSGVNNQTPVVVPCEVLDSIRQAGWSIFTRFVGENVYILTLLPREGGIAKIISEPDCDNNTAVVEAIPGISFDFVSWSDGSTENPHTVVLYNDETIAPVFQRKDSDNRRIYFFGFESESDVADWYGGNEGANKWYLGDALSYEGDSSLYVSNDGGVNNNYSISSSPYIYTYVYLKDGVYDISFNWLAYGESSYDYMRVALIGDNVSISPTASGAIPVGGRLNLQSSWQYFERTAEIPTEGWYKMVFFWTSDGSVIHNPAPAVDNVYLEYKESWRLDRMTWPITVTVADDNAGYATGSGIYYYNDVVTIEAVPNDHYRFTRWNDGSTVNPRTIRIADYYGNEEPFVAYFEAVPWTWQVVVDADHSGAATITGSGYYQNNQSATIAVVYPQAGWTFLGWMDNNDGTNAISIYDNPYTVNVDQDMHFTAVMTDLDTAFIHDTTIITDTLYIHDTIYLPLHSNFFNDNTRQFDEALLGDAINAKVYIDASQIVVEDAGKYVVRLYDVNGRLLSTKQDEFSALRFDVLSSGAYMIRIGEHVTHKVVVIK